MKKKKKISQKIHEMLYQKKTKARKKNFFFFVDLQNLNIKKRLFFYLKKKYFVSVNLKPIRYWVKNNKKKN